MAAQAQHRNDVLDAQLVLRATAGDEEAFADLFDRHAHPAWRLALAVGGSRDVATKAVGDGFTLALVRLHRTTTTLAVPFRLQVARASGELAATASRNENAPVDPDPNAVVTAFRRLPERSRAALWLTLVEGGSPAQVAPILGLSTEETFSLARRAGAGLRQRYARAGTLAGPLLIDMTDARPHLRAIVAGPVPESAKTYAHARWQAWQATLADDRRHPLGVVLPFNPWIERAVAAAAAALITAGVAAAIVRSSTSPSGTPLVAAPVSSGELASGIDGAPAATQFVPPWEPTYATSTPAARAARTTLGRTTGSASRTSSGGDIARGSTGGTASTGSTSSSSTPSDAPSGSSGGSTSSDPGAAAGTTVAGTPIEIGAGSTGVGATVGNTTIGTAPDPAPSSGTVVTIDPGQGQPPITISLP